jgi:hypothetical protein
VSVIFGDFSNYLSINRMNAGGNDGGRRRTARRAVTSKRKTKKLGYVAQASISHNDAIVEKFISDLREGNETPYQIAIIEANPAGEHPGRVEFGGGVFSIKLNGIYHRATLRGLLKGRGRFHHNPEVITAAKEGRHVLVEDLGFGGRTSALTHQIMAVMMYDQYLRALNAMGKKVRSGSTARSSNSRSSNKRGFMFNRTPARYAAEDHRAATLASLNLIKAQERRRKATGAGGGAHRHAGAVATEPI